MIDLPEIIRQLDRNAHAIHALAQAMPEEQANWSPAPEDWSMKSVMEHLYNEERGDFRWHLKRLLGEPTEPRTYVQVSNLCEALEGLLAEREASIAWLQSLDSPDWDMTITIPFGPGEETITLRAGDMLVSWVEHDNLHLRQMVELLHTLTVSFAIPYSTDYAGGW
jgi:uncharacterized damage-inducible protein DinB